MAMIPRNKGFFGPLLPYHIEKRLERAGAKKVQHVLGVTGDFHAAPLLHDASFAVDHEGAALDAAHLPAVHVLQLHHADNATRTLYAFGDSAPSHRRTATRLRRHQCSAAFLWMLGRNFCKAIAARRHTLTVLCTTRARSSPIHDDFVRDAHKLLARPHVRR